MKVGHADSYVLTVVRYYDTFYISAKHYTKKHPDGITLFYDICLNKHIGISGVSYLDDKLDTESFVLKREDGVKFDIIDRRLNKIQIRGFSHASSISEVCPFGYGTAQQ